VDSPPLPPPSCPQIPPVQALKGAGTTESIIWRDAERTFKDESFRKQMISTLEAVADGDYHQGMGYFCGFMLLLIDPADVAKILHREDNSPPQPLSNIRPPTLPSFPATRH
jgi:hypothetical protein